MTAARRPEPGLPQVGWVDLRERLRSQGRIIGATVSREADRWLVAVLAEGSEGAV